LGQVISQYLHFEVCHTGVTEGRYDVACIQFATFVPEGILQCSIDGMGE